MSTEPTYTLSPRGIRGTASRGSARGRAGRGGRPRLEAPESRRLALPAPTEEPPAPSSLTMHPSSGSAVDAGLRMDDDRAALNAAGRSALAISGPRTAAPPAPSGDADTRPVGTPTTPAAGQLTAFAAEPSAALSASSGNADTNPVRTLTTHASAQAPASPAAAPDARALVPWEHPGDQASGTTQQTYELHPGVAAALDAARGPPHDGALVAQTQLSRLQQSEYAEAQVARWRYRGAGAMSPPDLYYPERRHWPMRNWLMEAKETIRYLREVNVSGDPERPWVASFRVECLCLPVVSDNQARLIDFNVLWLEDGSRDYVSVITMLQAMLSDAGFAFVNLVPSWGQTLHLEFFRPRDTRFISDALFLRWLLVSEQDAWDQIARGRKFSVGREDVPFQALDPEVATAFPVEDDGDALMLTSEEQELLGMAVVTRLRLAQIRPREWSDTDSSRPEPKHRRGSADALMSIPSWPGSDEGARVWGGPLPEVVGSSSVASGDAPMLTPDENMSSAGGGCQDSPGFGPAGATANVFVATAGTGGEAAPTMEQPTVYVPVAAYPPDFAQAPSPGANAPLPAKLHDHELDEELKAEDHGAAAHPMARQVDVTDEETMAHHALREAQRQIVELQAAMAARDE
ncbi:hypothetical protein PHYSODRAFT_339224 [Phytophthora sojae]|uniref:Uncharacterized protein n=1 Tax=Phytophthora sojae (strain P6497) TaxID=1094619 RepID=G5A636_PHYSP|nr:hypothetical protein PHYSODRAFT_339224 [Phytophthora sojae]EGZ08791.1 hypothetical protein PHYSODRAFT_339224 [Phytophthora sojae]|eukprot:XP_009535424.1 hypothetical protein PHYSODRAFT_339224 [Phytophthora sojae]